ncbi:hypothetical protein V8V70_12745 [Mesobacillus zeae]
MTEVVHSYGCNQQYVIDNIKSRKNIVIYLVLYVKSSQDFLETAETALSMSIVEKTVWNRWVGSKSNNSWMPKRLSCFIIDIGVTSAIEMFWLYLINSIFGEVLLFYVLKSLATLGTRVISPFDLLDFHKNKIIKELEFEHEPVVLYGDEAFNFLRKNVIVYHNKSNKIILFYTGGNFLYENVVIS